MSGAQVDCCGEFFERISSPPQAVAWIDEEGARSRSDLLREAGAAGSILEKAGARPGDIAGLLFASPRSTFTWLLSCLRAGVAALPLSPHDPPARRERVLETSRAQWLCAGEAPLARPRAENGGNLAGVQLLVATSGTMGGEPGLIAHRLDALVAAVQSQAAYLGLDASCRWALRLPLHHVGGLAAVLRTILAGGAVVSGETTLGTETPTHESLVPTQLFRMMDDAEVLRGLRRRHSVLVGGGPFPAAKRRKALDAGVPLVTSYGLTETFAFVAAAREREDTSRESVAGRPLPGRRVEILPGGTIGVGGIGLCVGRYDGQLRPAGPTVDGLLDTGDLGRFDEHGCLLVFGRRDRRFVCGGENVQPEEIEAALLALPGVHAATVIPRADPEYGHRPVAYLAGPLVPSPEAIRRALREDLPGLLIPVAYHRLRSPGEGIKPSLADAEGGGSR